MTDTLTVDPDSFRHAKPAQLRDALTALIKLAAPHLEAYCIRSGRPVRWEAGDRCRAHGDQSSPCAAWLREPQCTHPFGARNGGGLCDECGRPAAAGSNGAPCWNQPSWRAVASWTGGLGPVQQEDHHPGAWP
jgi:hypothetical protein